MIMAGGAFFIDLTATGDRMGITLTLFLTAVAFQFVIEGNLPKISYRTRMDILVSTNYFWILFSFIENLVMWQLSLKIDEHELWKINVGCVITYYIGGTLGYAWFLWPSIITLGQPSPDFRSKLVQPPPKQDSGGDVDLQTSPSKNYNSQTKE